MGLQKQILNIALSQGVDTKTDPKQLPIGKLTQLINGYFQTALALLKRNGYTALSKSIVSTGTIATGKALDTYRSELTLSDGSSLYGYGVADAKWSSRGTYIPVDFSSTPVIRNNYTQSNIDSAFHSSGFYMYVWQDSGGGCKYSIFDSATNSEILANQGLSNVLLAPKALTLGVYLLAIGSEGTNLVYTAFNTTTLTSSTGTIATNYNATAAGLGVFDCTIINGSAYFVYPNNAGGTSLYSLSPTLVLSTRFDQATLSETTLNVFTDASFNVWVCYTSGLTVKLFVVNQALTALLVSPLTVDGTKAAIRITSIVSGSTATIYYESSGTSTTSGNVVNFNTVTFSSVVGVPGVVVRSASLSSKIFSYNSNNFFMLFYGPNNTTQPTMFLMSVSPTFTSPSTVIARVAPLNAAGRARNLPEVNNIATGQFQTTYGQRFLIETTSQTTFFKSGAMSGVFNFAGLAPTKCNIANDLLISGGQLWEYDGTAIYEQGFQLYPEFLTTNTLRIGAGGGLTGASLTTTNSYQYCAVYEWTDNYGQLHQSAPSIALTATTNAITLVVGITNASPTMTLTTASDGDQLFAGMLISSTTGITAGTTISSISGTTVTMSANATSTNASQTCRFVPEFTIPMVTRAGATAATAGMVSTLNVYGAVTSGSPIFTVIDTTGLQVGQEIRSTQGYIPATTKILGITGNAVTLSANATGTSTKFIAQAVNVILGTITNGSATVTGISATQMALLFVGQTIFGLEFLTSPTIITKGSTSVVMSAAAIGNGTTFGAYFTANTVMTTGQALSGNNVTTGTLVSTLSAYVAGDTTTALTLGTAATFTGSFTATVTNTYYMQITVPTLRLNSKPNYSTLANPIAQTVSIVLYRTQVNQSIFYRTSSVTDLTYNSLNSDTVTFLDKTSDADLIANNQLYTTGGEIENICAPAVKSLVSYKNRLVAIVSESPFSIIYSKQVVPNTAVALNPLEFVQNIDQKNGQLYALGVMDDKLILFKSTSIFYMVGDGPTASGTNNDFTEPQLITTDTGCTNPNSVVTMPMGLMYQSSKGIYLIDRSLQNQYIGANVESYNSFTVTSAKLLTTLNEVRFTLSNGVALVYNYFFNQWSVFSNISAVDSAIFQNNYTYLNSAGLVQTEAPGTFTDNTAFIALNPTTGWMSFAGVQGYQRVYKLLILGQYKSPHTLVVNISYDFASTPSQTVSIPVLTDPGNYQFRIFLTQQKCESIKVDITDSQSSAFGEGYNLSALALEVGVKTGLDKLAAAQSFG